MRAFGFVLLVLLAATPFAFAVGCDGFPPREPRTAPTGAPGPGGENGRADADVTEGGSAGEGPVPTFTAQPGDIHL
jgi:hypothetical protein